MKQLKVKDITLTAMFITLGFIIPIIFHTSYMFGRIFLPMHITVILCAMICGPLLGSICAFCTVILSTALTGLPPIYPVATIMIFELITYSIVSGYAIKILHKKYNLIIVSYISLIVAMICGRAVLGLFSVILIGMLGNGYSLQAFMMSAFITALPGIIIQLVIIPWIIVFLNRTNIIDLQTS